MDPGSYTEAPRVRGGPEAFAFPTELPDPVNGASFGAFVRLQLSGGRLVLLWFPNGAGVPLSGQPAVRETILLDGVRGVRFAYAPRLGGARWQTEWTEPALPGLVRIEIVPGPNGPIWPPIVVRTLRELPEE
jgi:hypothetical protein